MRISLLQCAALWMPVALHALTAQLPRPAAADSSVNAILTQIERGVVSERLAISILRNEPGVYSEPQRTAVADRLAALAIGNQVDLRTIADMATYGPASSAVIALARSGMPRYSGMDAAHPGEPFAGALDRLVRVQKEAPVRLLRYRALRMMLGVSDRGRALQYVTQLAQETGDDANDAVDVLMMDASGMTEIPHQTATQREQSLALLRELHSNHRVRNTVAAARLNLWLSNRPL